jgi:hypothetical protein
MSWFSVDIADDGCAISWAGNMLLGPGNNAVVYFALQFSAETKDVQSKQTFATCSRKLASHIQILQSFPKERK